MKLKYPWLFGGVFVLANQAFAAIAVIEENFETAIAPVMNYNAGSEFGRTNYTAGFGATFPAGWSRGPGYNRNWMVTSLGPGASTLFPASLGNYFVRIDANSVGDINGVPDYIVRSGINLIAGETYTFAADMFGSSQTGATVVFDLVETANPSNVINIGEFTDTTNAANGYITQLSTDFSSSVTTSGSYELRIYSNGTNDNHAFVDNIVILLIPEPGSISLLLLSVGAALVRRRR